MNIDDLEESGWWRRLTRIPDTPFALGFDEWDEWEATAKKKYPVRYFLSHTLDIWCARTWRRFVRDPWYWLKCRLWHRYNVVVCRSLPPTWCDRDQLMMHACFECLEYYAEKDSSWDWKATREEIVKTYTEGCGSDNFEAANNRADEVEELRALYHWWQGYKAHDDEDDHDLQNEKLVRLIMLRGHLWS